MTIDFKKLEKKTGIRYYEWMRKVISSVVNGDGTIRPVTCSGKYNHSRYIDHTTDIENACLELKWKYSTDNDAPRGGKLGDIIIVKADKKSKTWRALMKQAKEY
jgi:hypothetical protein